MQITSTAFQNNDPLDAKYSRDGENINPPLTFSEIPDGTVSLALIVEDPDAVSGTFTHWILYDMSPGTLQILEGEMPVSGKQGQNDGQEIGYYGPQPPEGTGVHRYIFRLLALDIALEKDSKQVDSRSFNEYTDAHVLETTEITATYRHPNDEASTSDIEEKSL